MSNIEGVSMYTSEVESIVSIKTEAVVNVSPELTWRLVQDPELRAAWDPMVQVRMRTAGGVSKVFLNRLVSGMGSWDLMVQVRKKNGGREEEYRCVCVCVYREGGREENI